MSGIVKVNEGDLRKMLAGRMKRMGSVIHSTVTPEQMCGLALESFRKTPRLQQCSPDSILNSVFQAAIGGFKIGGPIPEAHLVPFKDKDRGMECQLVLDYRGVIKATTRSGHVLKVEARTVHEHDEFSIDYSQDPCFVHRIDPFADDRGHIKGAYAVFTLANGTTKFEWMSTQEIEKVRAGAPAKNSPMWTKHYGEAAKKTVIKRGAKTIPDLPTEDAALAQEQLPEPPKEIEAETIRRDEPPVRDVGSRPVVDARSQDDAALRGELVRQLSELTVEHPQRWAQVQRESGGKSLSDMSNGEIQDAIAILENWEESEEGSAD